MALPAWGGAGQHVSPGTPAAGTQEALTQAPGEASAATGPAGAQAQGPPSCSPVPLDFIYETHTQRIIKNFKGRLSGSVG